MMAEREPVTRIVTPVRVDYNFTPGIAAQRFLHAIARGKLLGQRCPVDGKVYVPSRGACPQHGVATEGAVELVDKGTITTFTIVRVPSDNIDLELPYCAANILLDGADIPMTGLLSEVKVEDVRIGMRVQAVWKPEAEWGPTMENIKYFRPVDEPDVPFEKIQEHS